MQWFEPQVDREKIKADLLASNRGDVEGLELKLGATDQWVIVLKDATHPGSFRLQHYDVYGVSAHQVCASWQACLDEAIDQGYWVADRGSLDRLSKTSQWREGMAALFAREQAERERSEG